MSISSNGSLFPLIDYKFLTLIIAEWTSRNGTFGEWMLEVSFNAKSCYILLNCIGKTECWTLPYKQIQPSITSNAYFHTMWLQFCVNDPWDFAPFTIHTLCLP